MTEKFRGDLEKTFKSRWKANNLYNTLWWSASFADLPVETVRDTKSCLPSSGRRYEHELIPQETLNRLAADGFTSFEEAVNRSTSLTKTPVEKLYVAYHLIKKPLPD